MTATARLDGPEVFGSAYKFVHVGTERAVAVALVHKPELFDSMPTSMGRDRLVDLVAIKIYDAVANLRAAGDAVNRDSVVRHLEAKHGIGSEGALKATEWLDGPGATTNLDEARFKANVFALISLADKRRNAEAESAVNENTPAPIAPQPTAERFGRPIIEFLGEEPGDDPADVFDVHGLIVRGEPSLFLGEPKIGKTLLLEDLLIHVAAGRTEWCGLKIYRRCRVLLFLREDSERTTRRRIWQLARGAGIDHRELAGWLEIDCASPLYFDDPKLVAKLRGQLADFDISAIDSLSTIHNGDENSVERMTPVMNQWRDVALGTRTSLPIVHHFRKRSENAPTTGGSILQRARGSSLIAATTRHAVGVEHGPERDQIKISIESNHEVDTDPFVIARTFGTDEEGKRVISHARIGSLADAKEASEIALLDPVTLDVIRAAGSAGIGKRDLREAVIERLKASPRGQGVRASRVDAAAERLAVAGKVMRPLVRDGAWRAL